MKKVLIILIPLFLSVFLFSSALAIERVSKKEDSTGAEKKEEVKSPPPARAKGEETQSEKEEPRKETMEKIDLKKPEREEEKGIFKIFRKQKPGQRKEIKERYDYFIDKNGDGIDDRLEKKKEEKKSEKEAEKKKATNESKARRKR